VSQKTCPNARSRPPGQGRVLAVQARVVPGVFVKPVVRRNTAITPDPMYRELLSLPLLATGIVAHAQTSVHQLVLLNEGHYDYVNSVQTVPVSLGTYDPASGTYTEQVIIPYARFGNDVKVENEIIYVSADSFLLKYDANTFALLDQGIVRGIRRIALWNDELILTRGEYGVSLPHFVEVRDKNTFDLLYAITPGDGITHTCEPVEVVGDKAYIGMNNGFDFPNYTNQVVVVDLAAGAYEGTIDLGPDGYNPEHLMYENGELYAFNNKDYTGSSISHLALATASLDYTNNVAFTSGCGTSAAVAGRIYYMEYAVNALARYDVGTAQVVDTLPNGIAAYGVLGDALNGVLYTTTTDYVSTGTLYVTDLDGTVLNTATIGVAAGKMALDLRTSTGMADFHAMVPALLSNPVGDLARFSGVSPGSAFRMLDAAGRIVSAGRLEGDATLDARTLRPGLYFVRFEGLAHLVRLVKD